MILLLGGSGVLGRALQEKFSSHEITLASRGNVMKWMSEKGPSYIESFINGLRTQPSLIINAVGITNPLASESELTAANFQLPANLITAGKFLTSKIVTFGTIMEEVPYSSNNNKYLKSKLLFRDFLASSDAVGANVLHFQAHTWYGGVRLHEHMFLGQLLKAIRGKSLFEMSEGSQIREYHHIFDDMTAVADLINLNSSGTHQINHGDPYSLRDIAEYVLRELSVQELLFPGSLPTPQNDNFALHFACPENLRHIKFRPTLSGIAMDFRERLQWLG